MDRRVKLIAQMVDILGNLEITLSTGLIKVGNIVHNRDELPAEKKPGIVLLDGDEQRDPRFPQNAGRSERPGPTMMIMKPEVYIVLDVRKPPNPKVGEDLNTARAAIIDLVLHDAGLQAITGSNGSISYDGAVTDLARNRAMEGQMGLSFSLSYPFVPDEIAGANS